ncbi:MAG: elongation factor P [Chloroflexi bacterium]|nr:MAG: elongation factor P [Chloroflexota bacterium]
MIDVNQLRKGTTFTLDGQLYKVLKYSHNKPGRGKATIRVTVRNLRSGSTTEMTFNSGERVQDIRLEGRTVQFLYPDGEFYTFMDMSTYEQPQMRSDVFGDDALYLKEGLELKLVSYEGEIIDYELPTTIDFEVVESEAAVQGDTANAPTKKVKTETGLEVQVPLFVNVGDVIRVNTETGEYVTRVS